MSSIWVIKLGGSLTNSSILTDWLNLIAREGQGRAVIVPGGGGFADVVREAHQQWQFDDRHAHHMAVLAMQQMALLFHSLNSELSLAESPDQIKQLLKRGSVVIWSPNIKYLDQAGIPASWDVTSDSLSAWLAYLLSATTLTLIKSNEIPEDYAISELIEKGIVDKAFKQYTKLLKFQVKVVNRSDIDSFSAWFVK
jgi:aspartokinase-like uncharacterized kinase